MLQTWLCGTMLVPGQARPARQVRGKLRHSGYDEASALLHQRGIPDSQDIWRFSIVGQALMMCLSCRCQGHDSFLADVPPASLSLLADTAKRGLRIAPPKQLRTLPSEVRWIRNGGDGVITGKRRDRCRTNWIERSSSPPTPSHSALVP